MDSQLYFRSIHPFSGDTSAHQLSFAEGAILRVNPRHATAGTGGWTWGCLMDGSGQEILGWFPTGYVVLTTPPSAEPKLPWIQQQEQVDDRDDGYNFTGRVLGGKSPALDYSKANPAFDSGANPFTKDTTTGPLDHLRGDDRITIVASRSKGNHKFLVRSYKKVGKRSGERERKWER